MTVHCSAHILFATVAADGRPDEWAGQGAHPFGPGRLAGKRVPVTTWPAPA